MTLHNTVTSTRQINKFYNLENHFNTIHNSKYSYNKTVYQQMCLKATITCPIHGDFIQTLSDHSNGNGCQRCGKETALKARTVSQDTYISRVSSIHNNKYSYTNTVFTTMHKYIKVICPIHGEFSINASSHLHQEAGCSECAIIFRATQTAIPYTEFYTKATLLHNNKYLYDESTYKNMSTKILITCPTHGKFWQLAADHINKKCGCTKCSWSHGTRGFQHNKPGLLYYFKVSDIAFKIGVTNLSIEQRYSKSELSTFTEIVSVWYSVGSDAYDAEQRILKEFSQYKYTGNNLLKSGNTELLNTDISKLVIQPHILFNNKTYQRKYL